MKSLITWATKNSPAMNSLLIASLVVGAASLIMMRREVFPEFELEIVLVSVPYPGATPEEVEEGICQKIEEAVQSIDGIKKQTSVAREGSGFVVLELDADANVQKVLNEVRSEVDQIPSFPERAEEPDVQQITFRVPAIRVAVLAPDENDKPFDAQAEFALRELAEEIRDDILQLQPGPPENLARRILAALFPPEKKAVVSSANIVPAKEYQIDVEISEDTLREYGLSLSDVAQIVRRQNVELPGGRLKTDAQEILLVGKNKRVRGEEIQQIELIASATGNPIRIMDLGEVYDGFADEIRISQINGRPALVVSVDRTSDEDLFTVVNNVKRYVGEKNLPAGYEIVTWGDTSLDVEDRLNMLLRNGLQGLLLVFVVLAVFLELRLAFWVALGVPVAVLGAGAVLLFGGQTLNMLSMFAFLMALGIVVDDAIVIGENVYHHRQEGKSFIRASIDGTYEVLPSVGASVSTTIIAFMPLLFVSGVMGKFIAVMPVAVIAMLIISLLESTFVLPCHLAHHDSLVFRLIAYAFYPLKFLLNFSHWLNDQVARLLDAFIRRVYVPSLRYSLNNPLVVLSGAFALLLVAGGFVRAGITPFVVFPKLDSRLIEATVVFPNGTPSEVTDKATRQIEAAIARINEEYQQEHGERLVDVRHRVVGQITTQGGPTIGQTTDGSHVGGVTVELVPPEDRELTSAEVLDLWRAAAGDVAGVDSMTFQAQSFGPAGTPIEFKLLADEQDMGRLEEAVERCKKKLATYDGVFDIDDDWRMGKWEQQVRIKEAEARALDVTQADLSETIRASYYGEEVMRLQRGRHEVKLMVRYPEDERKKLAGFEEIRIRTADGAEIPITELADIEYERGITEINRVNQLRSITISADIDESKTNARDIVADLQAGFMPELLEQYPGVLVRWEGQQEQTQESIRSLMVGLIVAVLAMFVLLTLEFRSYFQPFLILCIIPFGFIGAIAGHAVFQLDLTLFSLFGLVALTGVVVNDSIVLIDFINHRVHDGMPLKKALLEAGQRRFRPVLLTSVTTIAGLIPLLMETSFQAQVLIPMATSLCFGLALATGLILILVPTFYYIYGVIFLRDSLNGTEEEDDDEKEPLVQPELIDEAAREPLRL